MQDSLIINVRRQLCWHRRLFSDASTLFLWVAWLWLCQPLFMGVAKLCGSRIVAHSRAARRAVTCSPATIETAIFILASTSVALLLWKWITARQALRPCVTRLPDYAGYFGVAEHDVQTGRATSICTVHHDEQGRIVQIQAGRAAA